MTTSSTCVPSVIEGESWCARSPSPVERHGHHPVAGRPQRRQHPPPAPRAVPRTVHQDDVGHLRATRSPHATAPAAPAAAAGPPQPPWQPRPAAHHAERVQVRRDERRRAGPPPAQPPARRVTGGGQQPGAAASSATPDPSTHGPGRTQLRRHQPARRSAAGPGAARPSPAAAVAARVPRAVARRQAHAGTARPWTRPTPTGKRRARHGGPAGEGRAAGSRPGSARRAGHERRPARGVQRRRLRHRDHAADPRRQGRRPAADGHLGAARWPTSGRSTSPTCSRSPSSASSGSTTTPRCSCSPAPTTRVQVLNLLLLLPVTVLPWPTAVLADYVHEGTAGDQRVAVLLYGLTNVRHGRGLQPAVALHPAPRRAAQAGRRPERLLAVRNRRYNVGLAVYPVPRCSGCSASPLFIALMRALALMYLLPTPPTSRALTRRRSGRRRRRRRPVGSAVVSAVDLLIAAGRRLRGRRHQLDRRRRLADPLPHPGRARAAARSPANVTNSVVQWPGYLGGVAGFRDEYDGQRGRGSCASAIVAVLGGTTGSVLLLTTPTVGLRRRRPGAGAARQPAARRLSRC